MIKEAVGHGIRYLCKCADYKDPMKYRGSGVYWRRVLAKHQCEVKTTILGHFKTNEALREAGIYYSKHLNIVEDPTWANLIEEIGDGGNTIGGRVKAYNATTLKIRTFANEACIPDGWKRGTCPPGTHSKSEHAIERTRQFHTGRKRSAETCLKMKNSVRRKRKTVICTHCRKQFTVQNLVRHRRCCESRQ